RSSPSCRSTRRAAARRGAVVVELALLVPFMIAIVFGICEIGQALKVRSVLSAAARAGCAVATRPGCRDSDVMNQVQAALTAAKLPANAATVTILVNDNPLKISKAKKDDKITVTVEMPTSSVRISGVNLFLSNDSIESQSTTMLKQG